MSANVGLAIQCVGVMLLALLSLSMRGSIKSPSLKRWTGAWISLSLALVSLFVGFHVVPGHRLFYSLYFFVEYAFGLMFIAGCRYHAIGAASKPRLAATLIAAAAAIAALLPFASADFNDLFILQATIMSGLFAASFIALRPAFK